MEQAPNTLRWIPGRTTMNIVLAVISVVSLVIVPRASQPIAVVLFVAAMISLARDVSGAEINERLRTLNLRAVLPGLGLFVAAAGVTLLSAYAAFDHAVATPKVLGLQVMVLVFYCLGRLLAPLTREGVPDDGRRFARGVLNRWMLGIVAFSTVLLAQEQVTGSLHLLVFGDAIAPLQNSSLNRSFLLISFALSYLLVDAASRRDWLIVIVCLVLGAIIVVVSRSEAAKLVIVIAIVFAWASRVVALWLMTAAACSAVVLTIVGPFLYGSMLSLWQYLDLAAFGYPSMDARVVAWANFSSVILDSGYQGRGLGSSKALVRDPSLFTMPHSFRAQIPFYPWHPHNAGLQVVMDLGALGIAWLAVVLWQIRGVIATSRIVSDRSVMAVATAFLSVSFVADGLWQTWWWMALAIIALAVGGLTRTSRHHDVGT